MILKSPLSQRRFSQEALTREQALAGMTTGAAYASFSEDTTGSIEVGKKADYVVFSQDIMTVPAERILSTTVISTVIDGKVAFGRSGA